jgi:hypothetical protein
MSELLSDGGITVLKLSTGEEIIAEVVQTNAAVVAVKNALLIIQQMSQPDSRDPQQKPQIGLSFFPWLLSSQDPKVISTSHVVVAGAPTESMLDAYERSTGKKKLITPSNGLVIPDLGV